MEIAIIQNGIEVERFNALAAEETSRIIGLESEYPAVGAGGNCRPIKKLASFLKAAAKPIVATKVGKAEMVIENGKNGLLVQPYNSDEIAVGLLSLYSGRQEAIQMGRLSRERVASNWSCERILNEYYSFYE